jgi:hypothetical protein
VDEPDDFAGSLLDLLEERLWALGCLLFIEFGSNSSVFGLKELSEGYCSFWISREVLNHGYRQVMEYPTYLLKVIWEMFILKEL